jgi:hypothetical protein
VREGEHFAGPRQIETRSHPFQVIFRGLRDDKFSFYTKDPKPLLMDCRAECESAFITNPMTSLMTSMTVTEITQRVHHGGISQGQVNSRRQASSLRRGHERAATDFARQSVAVPCGIVVDVLLIGVRSSVKLDGPAGAEADHNWCRNCRSLRGTDGGLIGVGTITDPRRAPHKSHEVQTSFLAPMEGSKRRR